MAEAMIVVRLTSEQKERLEQLANARNTTVSDVIRAWIDNPDMTIPPDLLAEIQTEATHRNCTEAKVIEKALRYAWRNRFVPGSRSVRSW